MQGPTAVRQQVSDVPLSRDERRLIWKTLHDNSSSVALAILDENQAVSRRTHIHLHSLAYHLHSLVWCSGKVVLRMPNLATNDMYDPYMVTDDRYDRYDRYITVT